MKIVVVVKLLCFISMSKTPGGRKLSPMTVLCYPLKPEELQNSWAVVPSWRTPFLWWCLAPCWGNHPSGFLKPRLASSMQHQQSWVAVAVICYICSEYCKLGHLWIFQLTFLLMSEKEVPGFCMINNGDLWFIYYLYTLCLSEVKVQVKSPVSP